MFNKVVVSVNVNGWEGVCWIWVNYYFCGGCWVWSYWWKLFFFVENFDLVWFCIVMFGKKCGSVFWLFGYFDVFFGGKYYFGSGRD